MLAPEIIWTQYDIGEFVQEVWKIKLEPFQLQDLYAFVMGGIFAYSIPTDFGKSMLLEMTACLRLCANANRRIILVKINDSAAREVTAEVARRLYQIATQVKHGGAPLYPQVMPRLRWSKGQEGIDAWGVGGGFDIEGIDYGPRNINKSFRGYSLGSRDLQGKRGDTMIDDIERHEEAESEAYRRLTKMRFDAVVRTLESYEDALWLMVGTAMHADSIYDYVCRKLEGINRPYKRIVRPYRNPDGSLLWPARAEKVEVHRRLMSKTAWNAAYELTPMRGSSLSLAEIEAKVRDLTMPLAKTQLQFKDWILAWGMSHCPPYRDPSQWRFELQHKLAEGMRFYIGWDPATVSDWAICVVACLGEDTWVLKAKLDVGDTWDQVQTVKRFFLCFPEAVILLEGNAQQKAFQDVAQQDELLMHASIIRFGTTKERKLDPEVGLPVMVDRISEGYFHTPWQSEDAAYQEFSDFEAELQNYGPTAHPHLLYAIWFCWRYHRQNTIMNGVRHKLAERELAEAKQAVSLNLPRPNLRALPDATDRLRSSTRAAWRRRRGA